MTAASLWLLLPLLACADFQLPATCVYKRGEVILHLEDPSGEHATVDIVTTVVLSGLKPCTNVVPGPDSSALRVMCEPGDPVTLCTVDGTCIDAEDGHPFHCQGSVTFQ